MPWLRRHWPSVTPARRTRAFRRLTVERLEDRNVLSQFQDFHGLRFVADTFVPSNGDLLVSGGTVQLGFTPAGSESYLALVGINLNRDSEGGGVLRIQTTSSPATFQLTDASLESLVQGGTAVPIWGTPDDTTAVSFNVPQLLSANGLNLAKGTPFKVAGFDFTLDVLGLANPQGGSTADANVFMQGSVAFTALKDKLSATAPKVEVNGGNYVIADVHGVQLTGATFSLAGETKSFSAQNIRTTDIGVVVTYSQNSQTYGRNVWSFDGAVTITTQPQGNGQDPALSNVAATVGMVLQDGHIRGLNFGVSASFTFLGVQVQSDAGNPLQFNFDFDKSRYQVRGGLTFTIKGSNTVDVNLGYSDSHDDRGILIEDGVVTAVNATVNTNFTLFGATITTNNDGLNFSYDRTQRQFEMYGSLQVVVPSGTDSTGHGKTTAITALLGDAANPGLLFTGGQLVQVHMGVTGQFNVYGLAFQANALVLDWKNVAGQDLFELSGSVALANVFRIEASFGTSANPGLKIVNGKFSLDAFTFTAERLNFGAFVIQELQVAYQTDPKLVYTLGITLDLIFPGGWQLGGDLLLVDGKVDDISLHLGAYDDAIPIGDTGLFLNYAEVSVQNIDSPANIVVSGAVSFVYGKSVTLFGKQALIVAAQGSVTVDKDELQLTGDGYFGAIQTGVDANGKPLYEGDLGQGDAQVTLDWGAKKYTASVNVSLLDGVVVLDADFDFSGAGKNYSLLIEASVAVEIPKFIPLIGGKKLDGISFVLDYHANNGDPYGFFAAWFELDIFHKFDVGFQYDIVHHKFSLIGSKGVAAINQTVNQQNQVYTYTGTFTVDDGATATLFGVDWPTAGGTQSVAIVPAGSTAPISQDNFSPDNGLSLALALASPTSVKVHAVGSSSNADTPLPPGQYQYILTSTVQYATPPTFTSSHFFPKPTAILGAVPGNPSQVQVPVSLSGQVDEAFGPNTRVSLYVDGSSGGYRGTLIPGAESLPVQTDGHGNWTANATWDLAGLLPLPYYTYAVVNDGTNTPVFSPYSASLTPKPPLSGNVTDALTGDDLSGLTVYLDTNNNGQFDPDTDPSQTTNAAGFYAFYTTDSNDHTVLPTGTPVFVGVVLPPGYEDRSPNPVTRTYLGVPLGADFQVVKLASVRGTVFQDTDQDGTQDPGEPGVPGIPVTLTGTGGTHLVAVSGADGRYDFYDLSPGLAATVAIGPLGNYYQTSPAPVPPGSRTVTITGQYQQVTGQDFGVLPFGQVAGTVQGQALNGPPSPNPTPLAGWTVHLMAGSQVVAATTSGPDGSYLFNRVRAGQYTVTLSVPAGWLLVRPFRADVQFASPGVIVTTGSASPNAIATGDFDADGFQDFAVTAPGLPGGNVVVYYGDGHGNFVRQQWQTLIPDPVGIVGFHFAATSRLDLAVTSTQGQVDVLQSYPGRTFAVLGNQWHLPAGAGTFSNLAAGYFDSDPHEDLAMTYQAQQFDLKFAALLANTSRDVIIDPHVMEGFDFTGSALTALVAGDINNDGQTDLFINALAGGSNSYGPTIAYSDGTGHFRLSHPFGLPPVGGLGGMADVDGNGLLDVIAGWAKGSGFSMKVYLQGPVGRFTIDGGFEHIVQPSQDLTPVGLMLRDFDGDLKPDLALVVQDGTVNVFPNQGVSPHYQDGNRYVLTLPAGAAPVAAVAADFTGDGLADLVLADPGAGGARLLLNQSVNAADGLAVSIGPGEAAIGNTFIAAQVAAIPPPPQGATDRYVWGLYQQVFGRDADVPGLTFWNAALAAGMAREAVVLAMWTSAEHRGRQVDEAFQIYLGRLPDPAGRRWWVDAMLAGLTEIALARMLLASPEYLTAHGGLTGALASLYTELLGRPVDPAGLAFWQAFAQGGGWSETVTALQHSEEALGRQLDGFYEAILHRPADPAGRRYWLGQLQARTRMLEDVARTFLSSDEYFARLAAGLA